MFLKSLSEITDLQTSKSLIKGIRARLTQQVGGDFVYLSEIAQIYQPQTISLSEFTKEGYLVYGANGVIGKYTRVRDKKRLVKVGNLVKNSYLYR